MRRSLIELNEVADFIRLRHSAKKAYKAKFTRQGLLKPNAGLNFMLDLDEHLITLQQEVLSQSYRPGPFRHFWICDRKPRFISAAPFRDRVVHHSLCSLLLPRLERYADPHSYACRPGRGLHRALGYAQTQAQRYEWALRLDIAHYFETVNHELIKLQLRRLFKGKKALALADLFIEHAPQNCTIGQGLPIGNLTSQHFANMFLGQLDHALRQEFGVSAYLRYMDDMTIFAPCKSDLQQAHDFVRHFVENKLQLSLKDKATRLGPTRLGISLLGFRVFPSHIRFDASRMRRYRKRRYQLDQKWKDYGEHDSLRAQSEALSAWAMVANSFTMRQHHSVRLTRYLDLLKDED